MRWSNRALGPLLTGGLLQPKLRVGAPGDRYEQEADRVADRVTHMPDPTVQRCAGCSGGTPCAECADEAPAIQRTPAAATAGLSAPDSVVGGLGAGRPLDAAARAYFEPRFGRDFGDVRVHAGPDAAVRARSVEARAFTIGRDVVFGAGEYAPRTREGKRLLAHELTHVIQQSSGGEPLIQRELVYGAGYPRRFKSDWAEVGCYLSTRCEWFPATIDFRATATKSGGGSGSATFSALLDHIEAAAPGSITELGLIGHANTSYFGLGGTITADNVTFSEEGIIGAESLEREHDRIVALRDRFADGATIVLYGCNAGAGEALLEAISNAFHVCVKGFSNKIITCLRWRTPSRAIFDRGSTWVEDPLSLMTPEEVGCENFHRNVRELTPDRKSKSCAGVPSAAAVPSPDAERPPPAPRRFGVDLRVGAGLSNEHWRAAVSLGARYSLRPDRLIVVNPLVGGYLVYLPPTGDLQTHVAAVTAELGLRVQQPLQGVYADLRAGAYVGVEALSGETGATAGPSVIGGFTGALGAGYRWERFELGAEGRGLVGRGSDHFVIVGVGSFLW